MIFFELFTELKETNEPALTAMESNSGSQVNQYRGCEAQSDKNEVGKRIDFSSCSRASEKVTLRSSCAAALKPVAGAVVKPPKTTEASMKKTHAARATLEHDEAATKIVTAAVKYGARERVLLLDAIFMLPETPLLVSAVKLRLKRITHTNDLTVGEMMIIDWMKSGKELNDEFREACTALLLMTDPRI